MGGSNIRFSWGWCYLPHTGSAEVMIRVWNTAAEMDHLVDRMKLTQYIVEHNCEKGMLEISSNNIPLLIQTP